MTPNNLPSERTAIVGVIDPDVTAAGAVSTGWVAAKDFLNFMAIVFAGTLGSSATLDAKIEQASDSSGTGAKDVTGKAITQMTQAGTDSDKQAIINVKQSDLDTNNGFTHLRLTVTVATASSDAGGVLLGFDPAYGSANDYDVATVDEIVV